jgi:hypothetical protein
MTRGLLALALALPILTATAGVTAGSADVSGKWTASFDTQIGVQNYTYDFVVKETTLTGKAKSDLGESDILEGKVEGDKISFVEILKFQDMDIRIQYTGTVASPDEIKFTRQVADFATEQLVAKRVK